MITMFHLIETALSAVTGRESKVHVAREFLQSLILKILFDRGHFRNVAFVGGTALRFLYGLRRFSEDLDFSVIRSSGYRFDRFMKGIISDLQGAGFPVQTKYGKERVVRTAMLRFPHLLYSLGLTRIQKEKLSVRVEVDTRTPSGWSTAVSLINKHFVYTVTHFDLPSLYATKVHACFFRKYAKGRDFYDLMWYLGRDIVPNFELLNNAIKQTEGTDPRVDAKTFRSFLRGNLGRVDFADLRRDVERFIEDKNELKLLDKALFLKLL